MDNMEIKDTHILTHPLYNDLTIKWDNDVSVAFTQQNDIISFDKSLIPQIIETLNKIYESN